MLPVSRLRQDPTCWAVTTAAMMITPMAASTLVVLSIIAVIMPSIEMFVEAPLG